MLTPELNYSTQHKINGPFFFIITVKLLILEVIQKDVNWTSAEKLEWDFAFNENISPFDPYF